ncbi:hypothetical protein HU230_0012410 [Bradyrhizobium quebecense]|uniref:Uncharacterized protein n=1 Tax=Bradyrhizobium quebecense TaxID=2748629 RepID=A0A973WN41_9BRAD|nr:hypothetical protein [Bradyrhizobium quebecense]UGA46791.1 hypothetical protein HU230_0012410 [Bradyrhizobium quebecense]
MAGDFARAAAHEVLGTDEYAIHIEDFRRGQDTFLLLHLRFTRWTPSVFKRFIAHWTLLRQCVTAPLFALGEVDDDKWERFVTRFGFRFLQTVKCENGETRRLFIHVLTEAPTSNVNVQLVQGHQLVRDEQFHR